MPFVLDCSVTMAWVFADEANPVTDGFRDSLIDDMAVVPQLWPVEVANVLLVATRAGRIQSKDWPRIHADLQALPIQVDPETHERAFQSALPLAHRHKLSVYDAVYLELAQRLELPLATLDKKLRSACREAGVKTI